MAVGITNSEKNILEYLSPSSPSVSVPELTGTFSAGSYPITITKSGFYSVIMKPTNQAVSSGVSLGVNGQVRYHLDPLNNGSDYYVSTFYAKATDVVLLSSRGSVDLTAYMQEF